MKSLSKWFKKYFIPHGGNEFKPHFLRHESMMVFLLAILVVELGFLVQVFIVFDKTNFLASVLPGVLTTITNEERAQNDAPPLSQNDLLTKAAQMKAEDMAANGYFAHTSPTGKTPWYWFSQVGYSYSAAGENLAVNFFESNDVAQAWMNSPTHRANIVKKDYTEIGIGVASGVYEGRNTVFVAQLFGTPIKIAPIETTAPVTTTPPKTTTKPATTKPQTPVTPPKTAPTVPAPAVITPNIAVAPTATQILGEETSTPTRNTAAQVASIYTYLKSFAEKVLTSPREYLSYIYGVMALLVILALCLVLFIRAERRHPAVMIRGLALMTAIVVLLYININILNLKPSVDTLDLSANAISSLSY